MDKLFSEEKAQISVELIIVLAAVVAVVLLLVSQIQSTSEEGSKKLEQTAEDVFKKIDGVANSVVLTPSDSAAIDGSPSYSLTSQYAMVRIQNDGVDWWII